MLESYAKDRFTMKIDFPSEDRSSLEHYIGSVEYFKKWPQKGKELEAPPSLMKNQQSVLSNRESTYSLKDSVHTKGDR
jgi:hypothetical protein